MSAYRVFSKVVKHCLTEKDGESFDIVKVLGAFGLLIYFGLSVYTVILNPSSFNYMNWGIGFGTVIGAIAGGTKIKESNEQYVPIPGGGVDKSKESVQS